jgi:hypothetical protein
MGIDRSVSHPAMIRRDTSARLKDVVLHQGCFMRPRNVMAMARAEIV